MDNTEREKFWNVLKNLHNSSAANVSTLMDASPWPKTLCRFRAINRNSLQQLSNNKLLFSSADHYDDPFDTYFYINVNQMIPIYDELRKNLLEGDENTKHTIRQIAKFSGKDPEVFFSILSNNSLDFMELKGHLTSIRNFIQRGLFSICFCENPYNETLWLKYAENYAGFVQIYDLENPDTFMCGKGADCQNCISVRDRPYIYPIYYSNEKYDATRYAVGTWLMENIKKQNNVALAPLYNYVQSDLMWEAERISLIKKKCHQNDQEWRMIRPGICEQRSCIKMKPYKVIIGLRTPDYESRLIVSAAGNAGIQEIDKLYINDSDILDSKPVAKELYHI